ncbi:DUF805 domain-containing protein [Kribbella jejuensis]|uniref:Uncharacterized membrane protein YhaH (DUF805 family) n=1 Tax=Kribbella jejuensis TaxID=236068 RepID=A0A542D9F5_9ACTN|nr:DUF805 domain-containing protein [Kribbella jejuensis]TQI99696.1 uncharacterized membrane protein YhaH (DUF805 family) [Kribbella jejuensis]
MQWYLDVLKKYVAFDGRARRKEFWMFTLFSVIISVILSIIDHVAGLDFNGGRNGVLQSIYGLAVLLPTLSVSWRRLHDTNRSGWWMLLYFTCIGIIVLIVFWAMEGQAGNNKYGPDPKAAERFGGPGQAEPGYPTV